MMTASAKDALSVGLVALLWLSVSGLLVRLMQGLLFGRPRTERLREDLRLHEAAALVLILGLLMVVSATFGTAGSLQSASLSRALFAP
jgi:cytochrome b subunit of formate dehydrogenase